MKSEVRIIFCICGKCIFVIVEIGRKIIARFVTMLIAAEAMRIDRIGIQLGFLMERSYAARGGWHWKEIMNIRVNPMTLTITRAT